MRLTKLSTQALLYNRSILQAKIRELKFLLETDHNGKLKDSINYSLNNINDLISVLDSEIEAQMNPLKSTIKR